MLRLTLRASTTIPIELGGITPDRLASLSALEIARLPLPHGSRSESLGELFEVSGNPSDGRIQIGGDTRTVKHIGAGMSAGSILVEGTAGMHAGARMTGGKLILDAGAGDWLGAELQGGEIEVRGSAGHLVGAAYRGSRRGMTGGRILVRGRAGDEVGLLMRRGLIAVEQGIGDFAAASMIAGTLVVAGPVGRAVGAGMKRGTLYVIDSKPEVGPGFQYSCEYSPAYLRVLIRELLTLDFRPTDRSINSTVCCYRGDRVNGGHGELLVTQGSCSN